MDKKEDKQIKWIRSSYTFAVHLHEKISKKANQKFKGNKTAYLSDLVEKDK